MGGSFGRGNLILGFFAITVLINVGGWLAIRASATAAKKLKIARALIIVSGLLAIGFLPILGLPAEALYLLGPLVAMSVWMNMKSIRFCAKCSAFNPNQPLLRSRFCRKCGGNLEDSAL
jgi:ribosomal protein L40E